MKTTFGRLAAGCAFVLLAPAAAMDDAWARYVPEFNRNDEELYTNAIPDAAAESFLRENAPSFTCPDKDIERTYHFRWWTYRKHIKKSAAGEWIVTEFLPPVPWAGPENTIDCALGHHVREGRWLADSAITWEYLKFMLEKGRVNGPRAYACWPAVSLLDWLDVTGDAKRALELKPLVERNFAAWERGWTLRSGQDTRIGKEDCGLFAISDNYEGTEMSLSGYGYRPIVNSAMYGEAKALARLCQMAGENDKAAVYSRKADELGKNIKAVLWNKDRDFFTTVRTDFSQSPVRELRGYAPWYFGMPLDGYEKAWGPLMREDGFLAPFGLTFPERSAPGFTIAYKGHECQWNGPSWPYATSVALTALARHLQGEGAKGLPDGAFAKLLSQYARQHRRTREDGVVVPWIDENVNPFTGDWISRTIILNTPEMRKRFAKERGKDYNHSTFCDLVISGLAGFIPHPDGTFDVKPLAPREWDRFSLRNLRHCGHVVEIDYSRTGGLSIRVDGKPYRLHLETSSMSANAREEGWDNLDPARREREPARLYWEAPLVRGAAAFTVEKCGGAEGDVSFSDGAMTVRKTNERGWIVIRAKERFAVKAGTTLRSFADAEVPDADSFHSVAVLRLSGKQDRLHSDWGLDAVEPFMCGGPKMGYLSCTAPNQTDRRFASLRATEKFGTNIAPVMVVAGAPSTSIWRRWGVEDHDRAHGAWKSHIGRHGGVKGRFSEGIPAEEYLARLAHDTDHTAKVAAGPRETRLVVDGKVEAPVIYKPNHGWPYSWYRTTGSFLSDEGVKLQTAVLDFSQCWGPDGFDPAVTNAMAGAVDQMRRAPDALYILSFNFNVPKEYTAARPGEAWLDSQGQVVYGDRGHCRAWRNGKPPEKCWPWPSMFSPVWRKDVETFISAAVEGLKRRGLAKRVVGFHICGYHDGQFSPYLPDHSAHAVKAFREWMAAERGTQLPADFAPPAFSSDEVFFDDTPEGRLKRDWQTFQHIAPLRVQERFAWRLKAAFGKEVVALHWCMDVLGGSRNGAYYLGEFMKSDVMDGLVAQPSYVQRLPSLALGEGIPSASFAHHGKLYVDEFDLRSYGLIAGYVKEPGAYGLGHARDFAEWQSIHHRLAGVSMARRQAWWYYEISGGFFEPPEIAADIGAVARLRGEQARAKSPSAWRPSAALVIDEEGLLARNMMVNNPPDACRLLNSYQLAAAGVPYEVWLAADFMKDPALAAAYRIVLLEGFYDMTEARAAFVRRLLADGRTVVLFAGTGAARGADRLGLKPIYRKPPVSHEVESLTGDGAEFRSAFYTDELRWSLGITGGPILALWRPACFSFGEMPGFKPLARYLKDGAAAAVEGQVGGGRLVALGEADGLTPALFNRLAREAGGYVPVTGGGLLQVDMNGDFISVHALKTGCCDFRLPFPCKVVNIKTGREVLAPGNSIPLNLVAGETRWYSLQTE